jgi:hypothetical protein
VIVPVGKTPFGLASREVFVVLDDRTLLHLDGGSTTSKNPGIS